MLSKAFDLGRSLGILYLFLFLGDLASKLVPIGVPASIWGLLLLFLALVLRIIKVDWVFFSANLLIRYMAILFVPVSVGIMKYAELLWAQMNVLIIPNVVSSALTLIVVGLLAEGLFARKSFAYLREKIQKQRQKEASKKA